VDHNARPGLFQHTGFKDVPLLLTSDGERQSFRSDSHKANIHPDARVTLLDLESRSGFGLWASVIVDEAVHQRAKEKSKFAELQMETMKSSKEPLRYRRYGHWEIGL